LSSCSRRWNADSASEYGGGFLIAAVAVMIGGYTAGLSRLM